MIWKMLHQSQLVKVFICSAVGSMGLTSFFGQFSDVIIFVSKCDSFYVTKQATATLKTAECAET